MENLKKYAIVDLHLHLDGSLSARAIIEVAKEEGINLPTYNEEELNSYLRVTANCKSLVEYLEKFDIPNLVLQTKNGIFKCTYDLLERLDKQGLKYVEIRMAPQLSTNGKLSQDEVVKTLIETKHEAESKLNIKVNFILCMMRNTNNRDANNETIEVARKYFNKGVVAVDLAGAESLFPNNLFAEQINLVKKYKLNIILHSGEASGADSVKTAIEFDALRIGHGIRSIEDLNVVDMLVKTQKPIETCPTSNIHTKAFPSYDKLPIRTLLEKGVKVTINTDNMTVSNTTLLDEFKVLENLGFTENEIRQLTLNAINSSFIPDKEKELLRKDL